MHFLPTMSLDSTDVQTTSAGAATTTPSTCWCGAEIGSDEKRSVFGVAWCSDCFSRILRACPRALRNATSWVESVDDDET